MRVNDLTAMKCTPLNQASATNEISGVFASDLLSHVMGNAKEGQVLITVLNNINVLGVADLLDLSAVVFTHNTKVNQPIIDKANDLDIPLFTTPYTTAEFVVELYKFGA